VGLIHRFRTAFLSLLLIASITCVSGVAFAQNNGSSEETGQNGEDQVSADFKGTIGLGLIGAELGFVLPAVAGLDDWWAFVVFPIVGAAGGAVAGYFLLEEGDGHPEAAVAVLVAGMALIVPATVLTLSATAYDPEEDVGDESDLAAKSRSRARRHSVQQMARAAGPGVVRLSDKGIFLGAPVVAPVVPISSSKEEAKLDRRRRVELRFPVVSGCF
jgi:hypothetical protein